MFYVYVLRSGEHQYIGYTQNLSQRLKEHNTGQNRATKPYLPWEVIFYEAYRSQKDALRREKYFKTTQGKRTLKLMLRDYWSTRSR